jgi:hypothetical protein
VNGANGNGQIGVAGKALANPLKVYAGGLAATDWVRFEVLPDADGKLNGVLTGTKPLVEGTTICQVPGFQNQEAVTFTPTTTQPTIVKVTDIKHGEVVYFVVGVPEVRYVRKNVAGEFVPEELIFYGDPENPGDDAAYYIEMKAPLGTPTPKTVRLQTTNPCRINIESLTGYVAAISQDVALEVAPDQPAPNRYLLLRSLPIISVSKRIASTVQYIPSKLDPQDPGEIVSPPVTPTLTGGILYPSTPSLIIQQGIQQGYTAIVVSFSPEETKAIRRGINSLVIAPSVARPGVKWEPVPETDVILREQPLNISLVIKDPNAPLTKEIGIETLRTKPGGVTVILERMGAGIGETDPANGIYEYRKTLTGAEVIGLGLIPANVREEIEKFACLDYAHIDRTGELAPDASNLQDSDEFIQQMQVLEIADRGIGQAKDVMDEQGRIQAVWGNFSAPPTTALLQSGGAEMILLRSGGTIVSPRAYIQNQANWFYYSGHGYYGLELLYGVNSSLRVETIKDTNAWKQALDTVFIAGCSLLDINDYNRGLRDIKHYTTLTNPGAKLAGAGPKMLLGYNFKSPTDNRNGHSDFTAAIVAKFFDLEANQHNPPLNWLNANKITEEAKGNKPNPPAYNSCGIDAQNGWYLYWNKTISPPQPKSVLKKDW